MNSPIVKKPDDPLEEARQLARAYLPVLVTAMTEKAIDPACAFSHQRDTAEFLYKVSGLAKKQEDTNDKGRFVFNINFSSGQVTVTEEKVVEASQVEPETVPELLEVMPQHIKDALLTQSDLMFDDSDDLSLDLSDMDD